MICNLGISHSKNIVIVPNMGIVFYTIITALSYDWNDRNLISLLVGTSTIILFYLDVLF